jgi:PAS domain S-box-containing protein
LAGSPPQPSSPDREERFHRLINLSLDQYWEQDDQFRFVRFLNTREGTPWHTDAPRLLGRCRWDNPAATPLQGTWADHRAVLEAHQPFRDFELVVRGGPHGPRYLSITGEPVFDAAGTFTGYCGTARDITQGRLRELRQRDTQAMLRMAAQVGRLGAWLFDVGSVTVAWSEDVCAILEVNPDRRPTPAEALGFVAQEDRARIRAIFRQCVKDGSPFDVETKVVTAKGHHLWVRVLCEAEWDAQGRVLRLQGAMQDISESKEAQQEILRLNAELEERVRLRTAQLEAANKELKAFSYSVAHDLRSPLAAIGGFTDALEFKAGDVLDGTSRHYVGRIRAGVKQMEDLITGLLSLTNISRTALQKSPVDLAPLARAILAQYQEQDPERSVQVEVAEALPAEGDPHLLAQVIGNLVGNAWKFTARRPRALIEVGRTDAADGHTAFFVRDNGAGFGMTYAAHMFEPFQRLHSSSEFDGNGIGLAIVHRIVTRHGGRVWAEGVPEEGACFYFTLAGNDAL